MFKLPKLVIFFFLSVLFLSQNLGCDSDSLDVIPYAYVNFTIDMQDPDYISLLNVGGSVIIEDEGYEDNGIIVCCVGVDEFTAFDCTCTYEISDDCALELSDDSYFTTTCPCCGSKFELYYGSVQSGSAKYSLQEYKTYYNGTTLRIFN